MSPSVSQLIRRLQVRNADRVVATDGGIHSRRALPCVSEDGLKKVENSLEFTLPPLVRALYLSVGNGGFGPQYGIVGTKGGARLDGETLESCYRNRLRLHYESPAWRWPEKLLPLVNYGCGMWACVDCHYARLPIFIWDPNNLSSGLKTTDAQLNWRYSFWDQSMTLKQLLSRWLGGVPESEPKCPNASWIKTRLGIALPHAK